MALVRITRNKYNRDVNEDYWMTHIYKLDMMSCANIYSSTNLQYIYLQYMYKLGKTTYSHILYGIYCTCSSCESYGG
jgi:hypothetical protein